MSFTQQVIAHLPLEPMQKAGGFLRETFFCKVIEDKLCLPCLNSKEHKSHLDFSIDWTAEKHQQKLPEQMRSLWRKKQENQRHLKREIGIIKSWKEFVNLRMKTVDAEYQNVVLFRDKEKVLKRLEKESKEKLQLLKHRINSMILKDKFLWKMYKELEVMYRKPDMVQIQHFENLTSSQLLQQPQPLNPVISSMPIDGLINRFYDQLSVSLDNKKMTSHVPIFEDLKCLFSHNQLIVTHNPARSNCLLEWGSQTLTSGKTY
ncbi:PREDICTED: tripartite motif-containing protein 49C-like [Elephantulus edwardii]|uniref:tripartite motif-containing protein 49C-like n=1 Tax=Elephantulus edwardii TaxID=28737 RepID=UPI0003F0B650|nr:PREDICTED: tripartite motif-containing protein 49C-like [Elephantulus edwardii]